MSTGQTDPLGNLQRTEYCGNLGLQHVGQEMTVMGWIDRRRDLGVCPGCDGKSGGTIRGYGECRDSHGQS